VAFGFEVVNKGGANVIAAEHGNCYQKIGSRRIANHG